ncbi:MAG: alpha/beta fold hydrolase [Nocardioidaceae bacterium]
MVSIVLAHSPLTGPAAWGRLPDALRDHGQHRHQVVVLDVDDDREPPYAARYVARAALQIAAAGPGTPLFLVGHSGAGYLLPQLGATQRAARRPVRGYLFVDAGIPPVREASRLGLMRGEDAELAAGLEQHLDAGGRFPEWTADELREVVPEVAAREALVASLRPRGRDFFTEPLPVPADWPDAPCGFLRLDEAYDMPARAARFRGWPVVERSGGHFAALADPEGVADDLIGLLDRL